MDKTAALADTLKKELRRMGSLRADREFRKRVKERGASLKASAIANLSEAGAKPCPYLKSTPQRGKRRPPWPYGNRKDKPDFASYRFRKSLWL